MTSEFKDIPGYEGLYKINRYGQIQNIKNNRLRTYYGKKYKSYPTVSLRVGGIDKTYSLHKLLALLFIPNPNNYPYVNHKNGDKTNFSLDNLEWCTSSQNTQHAYDTGLHRQVGVSHHKAKLDKSTVLLMRGLKASGRYSNDEIYKLLNIPKGTGYDALSGKTWKTIHGGPMQINEIESKLHKQIGVSMEAINWWILCTFLKSVVDNEEMVKVVFSSAEDCQTIELLAKRISAQFGFNLDKALDVEEDKLDLENLLKLPPKKLILPQGGDIIA